MMVQARKSFMGCLKDLFLYNPNLDAYLTLD